MSEQTDWDAIERDYRAGLLSVREIAKANDISHTAIAKRAKGGGWPRDLTAKIQAKAEALVAREAFQPVAASFHPATERQIVDANADRIAQIRLEHRSDISKARKIAKSLLSELDKPADEIKLPAKVSALKTLAESMKTLIGLEREAYGMDKIAEAPLDSTIDHKDGARRLAFILARADQARVH